ncbi:MAG TPA: NAD(P)-dependent oxidoreductase [Polyangia bacterium]|nr:NAD(P)-dependent oxidoreductase [Polyangia bacterium]
MALRIFVAGAAGVIGRRLLPLLLEQGYDVHGTTRSRARANDIARSGAHPLVLDAFDRQAVFEAVGTVGPHVLIHQLTDLSGGFEPQRVSETLARNSRLRTEGTRNVVDAARAAGVRRLIAQSIAWVYAPGPEPHGEGDPLDRAAEGSRAVTTQGVLALEDAVLDAAPVEGVVLRYGWLYGPGASEKPAGVPPLHVDAAADAARRAIARGAPGVYNIAEPGPCIDVAKARRELEWDPSFRRTG